MDALLNFAEQIERHPDKAALWFLFEDDVIVGAGTMRSLRDVPRKDGAHYIIVPRQTTPQRAQRHEQRCPECNCDQSGIKYEDWRNDPYCDGCSLENGVEGFD